MALAQTGATAAITGYDRHFHKHVPEGRVRPTCERHGVLRRSNGTGARGVDYHVSAPRMLDVKYQERLMLVCNLRLPKARPMRAPKSTVAIIAVPCAPSACPRVETGHAIRQSALIATPAPAPYRAPATVGRVATEFRNIQPKSKTRIPPAIVLPIPQAKPTIPGETLGGALAGLVEKVSRAKITPTKDAAITAE